MGDVINTRLYGQTNGWKKNKNKNKIRYVIHNKFIGDHKLWLKATQKLTHSYIVKPPHEAYDVNPFALKKMLLHRI